MYSSVELHRRFGRTYCLKSQRYAKKRMNKKPILFMLTEPQIQQFYIWLQHRVYVRI
jgi:hypothetical protein